jgi:hypothetical protein
MNTAKAITDNLIAKMKRQQRFTVERRVPKGWMPLGTIPLDVFISKGIAEFEVVCETMEEAVAQVDNFLREQQELGNYE